jgi:hypothetical protein
MKKILMVILLGLAGLPVQASVKQVDVSNTDVINIAVNESSIFASISYPGPTISGICGLEIRADSWNRIRPIKNLLDAVEISAPWENVQPVITVENDMTILIDLSSIANEMLYATAIQIKTKDGKSVKDVIQTTLGNDRTVVLVGRTCEKGIARRYP